MKKTIRVPLGDLQIHPLVLQMKQYKPNHFMIFSLKNFGQKTAVVVVMRKDRHYIIDGGHRYYSAVEAGNIETLECIVLDIPNSEIIDTRITYNQKTKVHISEKCTNIEHMLGLMGNDQGKRNDLLGMQNINGDDEYGTAGKNKFEIACMQSGLDFSGRTLRKLMSVYEYEKTDDSLGLIEGIDNGTYKIDGAYNLMLSSKNKDDRKNTKQKIKIDALNTDVWFKIFEQSSVDLSNLKKYRPQFAMFSPTYWTMKEYRNQGEMRFGQEPTLKEYLENCRKFIEALIEIMDENLVSQTVLNEMFLHPAKAKPNSFSETVLIDTHLKLLSRVYNKEAYQKVLNNIHQAQIDSLEQLKNDISLESILSITERKGGYSLLMCRHYIQMSANEVIDNCWYQLGGMIQMTNDLYDIYKDSMAGIYTFANTQNEFKKIRDQYVSQVHKYKLSIEKLDYDDSKKLLFQIKLSLIPALGYVALENLKRLQGKGDNLKPFKEYPRKDLIVDMEKVKNIIKLIKFSYQIAKNKTIAI